MGYEDIDAHHTMLKDRVRTEGYRDAIHAVVRPGDVVVDLGCGTGVLSIFASQAGAARVYAIERTSIVKVAEQVAAQNGISNISFIPRKADAVVLPEPVNVLVSEWMGEFLFQEKMFEAVVRMRDRVLAPGGKMLPLRARLHAALMADAAFHAECSYFSQKPYGIDYAPVGDWLFRRAYTRIVDPKLLVSDPVDLGGIDMMTCSAELPPAFRATFTARQDAVAHAICGWFSVDLSEAHSFDTGPHSTPTHWQQKVFPFVEPVVLRAGEPVRIEVRALRVGKDQSPAWQWEVEAGGKRYAGDDFMHDVWMQIGEGLIRRPDSG
jgi:ubiquinone/menaquinone biosynthesis C-methylase UbiE